MIQVVPLLRLVHDGDSRSDLSASHSHFEPVQTSLLVSDSNSLIVCTTDSLDESTFLELFSEIRPSFVIDLRTSPRFDFGALNRRRAFALFEGLGAHYFDYGALEIGDDPVSSVLATSHVQTLLDPGKRLASPLRVVVLVDSNAKYRDTGIGLANNFRRATAAEWDLVIQGPSEESKYARTFLFISHANPEDNDFVLWLQSQLTRNGYFVWSDLTHLGAGDTFWESIEATIRHHAVRVIVVNSKTASIKPGVQDEISLALSIERAEQIAGFVIPLRIDDLPFSDFRVNIARKNAIDFSASWANGLRQLIDTLKRDGVPKQAAGGPAQLAVWWEERKRKTIRVSSSPETLVSNQIDVLSLPTQVHVFRGNPTSCAMQGHPADFLKHQPLIPHGGEWLSFYSFQELQALGIDGIVHAKSALTEELLKGNVSFVTSLKADARDRLLIRLLNRHWEFFLLSRGMSLSPATRGASTIYVTKGLLDKDQTELMDVDGIKKRRILVGHSKKRKVCWHLGVIGRFTNGEPRSVKLRLRVVFTDESTLAPVPPDKTKDLRRRFCKNWWNDRWRTLQLGFLHWLAEGAPVISIYSGSSGSFSISSSPRTFLAPFGIDEAIIETSESQLDDIDFGYQLLEGDEADDEIDEAEVDIQ